MKRRLEGIKGEGTVRERGGGNVVHLGRKRQPADIRGGRENHTSQSKSRTLLHLKGSIRKKGKKMGVRRGEGTTARGFRRDDFGGNREKAKKGPT